MYSGLPLSTLALIHGHQGRLPELEELQKLLSSAHEELADVQFQSNEERAASAVKQQQLQERLADLEGQLQVMTL